MSLLPPPASEPVLYAGMVAAVAQGLIASPKARWTGRRKVGAAVAVALATALIDRQLVSPYFDAPAQHAANAGLPPQYQPPPHLPGSPAGHLLLRDVVGEDIFVFFDHQLDPEANHMAAFTAQDPTDKDAFTAHWAKILGDDSCIKKTVLWDGQVVGHVAKFEQSGRPEVTYWIAREYWGRGVATRALSQFLPHVPARPLFARAAKDNIASIRVLQKCGFTIVAQERGYANARGEEIDELVLQLGEH